MLKFNTFRAERYLRSRFIEGTFLLASEATDLQLELIDFSRHLIRYQVGDVCIEDAWKVERIDQFNFRVKPGEAWFDGLPFFMRSATDQLVSGDSLALGIAPINTLIADDPNGTGKIVTLDGSTADESFRIVIQAKEEVVTNVEDPFIKNANISESTAQKMRIVYSINIVPETSQVASPVPYTGDNSTDQNLINQVVVQVGGAGSAGSLISTNAVSGSEQIDGRDIELSITNQTGSNPIPKTIADAASFSGGTLIDNNGNEFYIVSIFNNPSDAANEEIIRIDKEVGQANPTIALNANYTLVKRDVFNTDDVNGTPNGKRFMSIATVAWKQTDGIVHESSITDLRNSIQKVQDSEETTNLKFDLRLATDGTIVAEPTVKAAATIDITDYTQLAGDTISVRGVNFVEGVDFSAVTDNDTTAANIAQAINDSSDILIDGVVEASVVGATITLEATAGGTAANAYTVSFSDDPNGATTGGQATLEGGVDGTVGELTWDQQFTVINPHSTSKFLIAPGTAILQDGGSLAYFLDYDIASDTNVERGTLAVTTTNFGIAGTTISFSGAPDLSNLMVGNTLLIASTKESAAITAIDDINKTVTLDGALTAAGAGTIYLDTFAAGTIENDPSVFVLAVKTGGIIQLTNGLGLNSGESTSGSGGVPQQLLDYIGSPSETDDSPSYSSTTVIGQGDALTVAVGDLDASLGGHLAQATGAHAASAISYDNASSGMAATEAQGAIDELDTEIDGFKATGGGSLVEDTYYNATQIGAGSTFGSGEDALRGGQTFTASSNYTADTVGLAILNASGVGTIKLSLYATAAGVPTGGALASTADIDVTTLLPNSTPTPIPITEFPLTAPLALTSGTQYAIVVDITNLSSGFVNLRFENTNEYAGGTKIDNSAGWSTEAGNDVHFKVSNAAAVSVSGASSIGFNNTASGLAASNVQDAIDEIDNILDVDVIAALEQLRLETTVNPNEVSINGIDDTLLNSSILSQEISNFLMSFPGATIDFTAGTADVTVIGLDAIGTSIPSVGEYKWFGVGLLPNVVDGTNKMTVQIQVTGASASNAVQGSAPFPNVLGDKKLGAVLIQNVAGAAVVTEIRVLGVGSGGGGSGTGDANSLTDTITDNLMSSNYEFATPNIFSQSEDDLIDSVVDASYSIVTGNVNFPGIADSITSTNMLDSEYLNEVQDISTVRLMAFWDATLGLDDSATYEVSRDAGASYETVSMERIGTTDTYVADHDFTTDGSVSTQVFEAPNTGSVEWDNASVQAQAQPFTLAATTVVEQVVVPAIVTGSPTGVLSVRITTALGTGGNEVDAGDTLVSTSVNVADLGTGNNFIDVPRTVLGAGTYYIVISGDSTYQASFVTSTTSISWDLATTSNGSSHDGASWTGSLTSRAYDIQGYELDLRVRITSGTADVELAGYGILYGLVESGIIGGIKNRHVEYFNSTSNPDTFTISFLPDPDLLKVYLVETGQVFKAPSFTVDGKTITFPADSFDNGGVSADMTLIFDQSHGSSFDNSDQNAALMAANFLGSTDASIDRSSPGRGILIRRPDGQLVELTINNSNDFEIYEVTP